MKTQQQRFHIYFPCKLPNTLCDPVHCSLPGSSVHGDSPGKNTGVGCHALLQGIFPTQASNPGLPHCRWILYHLSHQESPNQQQITEAFPGIFFPSLLPILKISPCFLLHQQKILSHTPKNKTKLSLPKAICDARI